MGEAFKQYQRDLAPPWLQENDGKNWLEAFGEQKDEAVSLVADAARLSIVETAPLDALGYLARSRGFSRYPNELLDLFRERVQLAFEFWKLSGTEAGMLLGLYYAGYNASIVEHFREDPTRWSQFSVYVAPLPGSRTTDRWSADGSTWGDDGTRWGFGLYEGEPTKIRGVINELKPGHSKLAELFYIPEYTDYWGSEDSSTWGGDGTTWVDGPVTAI